MAQGKGVVVLVGAETLLGRLSQSVSPEADTRSALHAATRRSRISGLVDEAEGGRPRVLRHERGRRQEADVQARFARIEKRSARSVCLYNAGSNVNKPLLRKPPETVLQGVGACADGFSLGAGRQVHDAARPWHHPVYRRHRQCALAEKVCRVRICEFGLRCRGADDGVNSGQNIHVLHRTIDAAVEQRTIPRREAAKIEASDIPPDSLTKTSSIADRILVHTPPAS